MRRKTLQNAQYIILWRKWATTAERSISVSQEQKDEPLVNSKQQHKVMDPSSLVSTVQTGEGGVERPRNIFGTPWVC